MPNGYIAAGSWCLYDKEKFTLCKGWECHRDALYAFAVLAKMDFSWVLSNELSDETIKTWNLEQKIQNSYSYSHNGWVRSIVVLKNGNIDFLIQIWNFTDYSIKFKLYGHTGNIDQLVTLKNGDLVSGSYNRSIKIWDSNDGSLKLT